MSDVVSTYVLSVSVKFVCLFRFMVKVLINEDDTKALLSFQNNKQSNDDVIVMATLRLLRLLVKHAGELREVLELGLAATPTGPWRGNFHEIICLLGHNQQRLENVIILSPRSSHL